LLRLKLRAQLGKFYGSAQAKGGLPGQLAVHGQGPAAGVHAGRAALGPLRCELVPSLAKSLKPTAKCSSYERWWGTCEIVFIPFCGGGAAMAVNMKMVGSEGCGEFQGSLVKFYGEA